MSRRAAGVAAVLAGFLVLGSCGKKGPPLPPLRPQPARITEISAEAVDTQVEVTVVVPAENADGTTPSITERVELYALVTPPAAPPAAAAGQPTAPQAVPVSQVVQPDNLVATVAVPAPPPGGEAPAAARIPIVHDVSKLGAGATVPPALHYAAVSIGRGRRGQPSPVIDVPLDKRPDRPSGLTVTFDESSIVVSWEPPAAGQVTHVYENVPATVSDTPVRRSTTPVNGTSFSLPVTFGTERCFTARRVLVAGRVSLDGPATAPQCVTPVDRFPPPAPGALVAIAEQGAVVLSWRGVQAADLAGYLVLRAEGASETLQPLTPSPIAERQYRDVTARSGVTYTYAVVAVDRAQPPNRSPESNRETVVAR